MNLMRRNLIRLPGGPLARNAAAEIARVQQ
jgi:hypothetical protein